MNEITSDAVKSELGSKTNARGYRVFSREGRAKAIEYAKQRLAEGGTVEQVLVELGLNEWTLQRWLQQERGKPKKTQDKGFARIEVMKAVSRTNSAPVVLGPAGVRVEGLQLAEVAELLRRLSCSV